MSVPPDHPLRPYPRPKVPPVMRMEWVDLLFMHWPLPPEALRPFVPRELPLDTFDGQAYLGVVPFLMTGTRPRLWGSGVLSRAIGAYQFGELNVRTYVTLDGKPGVYFFSLDAASRSAVRLARTFFRLRYFDAEIDQRKDGEWIHYRARRTHAGAPPASFEAAYRPIAPATLPTPGTLEHFLTERYALYTVALGRAFRGDIHHAPWPLQRAECEVIDLEMTRALNLELPKDVPLLHYARHQEVVGWPLVPAGRTRDGG